MRNLLPDHIGEVVRNGELSGTAPGAALLIDAAGSTLLSVELRRYGVEGAEGLADVLAAVFAPMVDEVYSAEGFIAEFAGDGIIAVFLGPRGDATQRAVAVGRQIMARLDRVEEVATPAGPARLTVRGIVGAGDVEWRVWHADGVAGQDAAYTYVGSAIAEAERGEQLTEPGVFSVGPGAASAVGSLPVAHQLPGGFVALEPLATPEPPAMELRPPPDQAANWRFFPDVVEQSSVRGEFREVVSVFVELAQLPESGAGENEMTRLLHRVGEHGGYLCDVIPIGPADPGVRALVFWGAPASHGHDVGHALRCVAAIRHDLGADQIRAGVTMDTVFAGYVGTDRHESYTCVGAGVNLAARICGHAGYGEIRIDAAVAARLDPRWTFEDLGTLPYKGFLQPVQTFGLTRIPAVIRSFPSESTLVGRDVELAALERALEPMWRDSAAGVVAIVGEAGIGKGHLVAELRRRLDGRTPPAVWLSGQSDETHDQPLATFVDALEGYFGGLDDEDRGQRLDTYMDGLIAAMPRMASSLERARKALAELLELDKPNTKDRIDPRSRFENIALGVRDLILAVSETAPVVVHNADAQWLDSGTVELLRRLRETGNGRFAILLETREAVEALPADVVVDLGPLDGAALSRLAHEMLDDRPSPALVDLLLDRSGGNPFYARELIEYMRRQLLLESGPDGLAPRLSSEELPMDLRRIVIADLDDLGPDVVRTLQTAAVIGREFEDAVLARVLPQGVEVEHHLGLAVAARIIEISAEGVCRFRHSVVRDTAYSMQLHAELKRLHTEAAVAIESLHPNEDARAAQIAFHYDRAQDVRAVDCYLRAARVAAHSYSNTEALGYVERGLELAGTTRDELRYELLDLARVVHDRTGDRVRQQAMVDAMRAMATTRSRRLEVALRQGELLNALGRYEEAEDTVSAAVAEAETSRHELRVALLFLLARLCRHRGDADRARKLAERARIAIDPAIDPRHAAQLDDFLGSVAWDVGDFAKAARLHRSAAAAMARLGDAVGEVQALNNLGSALFGMWDYPEALAIHEQGVERSREIGYRLGESDHLDNVGGAAWAVGDYDTAIARYSEALDIRREMADAWGMAVSTNNLAGAHRSVGDLSGALELYEQALEIDKRIGRRRGEGYDWHGIGLTSLDLGRLDAAAAALEKAIEIRSDLGETHLCNESRTALALVLLRQGRTSEALDIVEDVLDAEGANPFAGAAEATATFLRAIEVLATFDPERAGRLREIGRRTMLERAGRISDVRYRRMYLENVAAHREMAGER